jgi:hypothetical protein
MQRSALPREAAERLFPIDAHMEEIFVDYDDRSLYSIIDNHKNGWRDNWARLTTLIICAVAMVSSTVLQAGDTPREAKRLFW